MNISFTVNVYNKFSWIREKFQEAILIYERIFSRSKLCEEQQGEEKRQAIDFGAKL